MRRWRLPVPVLAMVLVAIGLIALAYAAASVDRPPNTFSPGPPTLSLPMPTVIAVLESPTAVPTMTLPPTPEPSPKVDMPTLEPSPTLDPIPVARLAPPDLLVLPASEVHDAPLLTWSDWLWATDGSTMAYLNGDGRKSWLETLDVVTGTTTVIEQSKPDAGMIVDYDGSAIIWLESHQRPYGEPDAVPGGNPNANHWAIKRYDFGTGQLQVIDRGVNHWITDDSYTHDPYIAVDGDLIAYDTETQGRGKHAQIIVRRMSTGMIVRTIQVDKPVFAVALSDGDLTYVKGDVTDPAWDSPINAQRILSPADGPEQLLPPDENFDVVEDGVTVSIDSDGPQPYDYINHVYASTGDVTEQIGIWNESGGLVHGDGLVAWLAKYDAPPGLYYTYGLTVYDTVTGQVRLAAADESMDLRIRDIVGLSGGWFIWTTSDGTSSPAGYENRTAHAVRTADIRTAFDALGEL